MAMPGQNNSLYNGTLHFDSRPSAAAAGTYPQPGQQAQPNNLAANNDPNAPLTAAQQQQHQRTYQACIPCRRRKVRCDLGSVDSPHEPPCQRCRRESKECFFSATRRKRKGAEDGSGRVSEEPSQSQDGGYYEVKSGRKRLRASTIDAEDDVQDYDDPPRTPGGSIGRSQPLRRPDGPRQPTYGEDDLKASDQTTAILQASEVHSGHDALKVLYEAAVIRGRTGSMNSNGRPSNGPSPTSLPPATSPVLERQNSAGYRPGSTGIYQNDGAWRNKMGSIGSKDNANAAPLSDAQAYAAALRSWSRFRFVRQGLFTAKEGIAYVEYFYNYLSPLTPVALPDFRAPELHGQLLVSEPMLSITILLIASRHMDLEGPGSQSRPYVIHQKLWEYLQGMVDRLVWGQEQFGGGFCGAGAEPGCDVNPLSRKGLRTLGTAESLILLTEWHPRAMHFPPDEDDDDLMMPEQTFAAPDPENLEGIPKGIGGQRMDSWLEPCWRSDRMCWMLLGIAMNLSYEIGVFDKCEWQRHARSTTGQPLSAEDLQLYDRRRGSVRDLLLVYVTLTSGRLGLTSMLPSNYSKPEDSELWKRQLGQHDSIQETVLHFWLRIAATLREGNQRIFANKAFTRDLIKNGNYKAALDQIQIPFLEWRRDLDRCTVIPKYMRCILEIEYDYCRVYLNALALQAVAERCANEYPVTIIGQPQELVRSAVTTNGVRTDVAITPQTLSKWLGGDRKYMIEVRDAACHLLTVVVDGLYPGNFLKHAPVRTYFRIISVAIMLLKSFSLGASETDVADSLKLMDRTVDALRTCIVDDVHVASRFADLLDTLTQNLKPRLVRISADGRPTRARADGNNIVLAGGPLQQAIQQQQQAFAAGHTPQHNQQQSHAGAGAASASQNAWPQQQQAYTPDPSNPLFGISNDAYDLVGNDSNYSVMPPPSFGLASPTANSSSNLHNPNNSGTNMPTPTNFGNAFASPGGQGFGDGGGDMQDWLALPLDPLLGLSGADVHQTMYGPELGGQDMLELLLNGGGAGGNGNGNGGGF